MGSQVAARPLRMAILNADTPLPQTGFAAYSDVFADLFRRAVAPQPLADVLDIRSYHVVTEAGGPPAPYPDLDRDELDAVLITGSKHNAYDDEPWINALVAFAQAVLATTAPDAPPGRRPVRLIGVCFGHQIAARALGAPVQLSPNGWEVSVTELALSPAGKAFFGMETLSLHQMHRDAVLATPPGAVALAATANCPVQAFLLPGRMVTVQGHPEFTGAIVRALLESRHDLGVLTDALYTPGIARVDRKHDGEAVARVFLRFAGGEES